MTAATQNTMASRQPARQCTRRRGVVVLACLLVLGVLAVGCARRNIEPALPVVEPSPPAKELFQPAPPPGPSHIGFLLPLSGPYAPFAQRILDGAYAARAHMAGAGVPVNISVVDTTAEGWVSSYESLPAEVRIVGGPLRPEALSAALASRNKRGKAVVTFMAELPDAVVSDGGLATSITEGRDAWRFFTGPQDNIRALLSAVQAVGLDEVGILYPEEPFGQRRAALFGRMAAERGVGVAGSGYEPNDPERWYQSTAQLIAKAEGGGIRAVYIPDSWSQARMLIPNLLVLQKDRSLVLGSALWSQTQNVRDKDEALLFNSSVYPGAWWSGNDAQPADVLRRAIAATESREAGYWEALGFDFVRLASRMADSDPYAGAEAVTTALQRAAAMDWSMAPMHWDEQGRASQDLYLFTPALYGPMRADIPALRSMLGAEPAAATQPAEPASSTATD